MSAEPSQPERSFITGLHAVERALRETPFVYCRIIDPFISLQTAFVVRDARMRSGELQVKILEGWYTPAEIWIEVR